MKLFFGAESNGIRKKGLVDYDNDEEFDAEFDTQEHQIISTTKIDSLASWHQRKKSIIFRNEKHENMLKPVRIAAGLGNSPRKWDNNVSECLHSVLKEEVGNELLDASTFLERAKERVFDAQFQEMFRAIRGLGEYKIVQKKKGLEVSPEKWSLMTEEQRRVTVEKILKGRIDEEIFQAFSFFSTI